MNRIGLATYTGTSGSPTARPQTPAETRRVPVPVMYPSGATAVVEVTTSGNHCFVSDMGFGHMEAELVAAADLYGFQARQVAEKFGVGFDGLALFVIKVPVDRLTSAITVVANASAQAAIATVMAATEQREARKNEELFDRVQSIFGSHAVAKTFEIKGRFSSWEAHNVVQLPNDRRAIFEFVSDHVSSVSSKFLMFSDITKTANPPITNSVVRGGFQKIGSKGDALADVSNIIDLNAPSEQFRRFAFAA